MKIIDKDKVVAEIEKTYKFHEKRGNEHDSSICDVLYGLSHRIDTLEAKDIDFDKEINLWFDYGFPNDEEILDYIKETAKHFYELGLKVKE